MNTVRSNLDVCYYTWRSVSQCDIMIDDSTKRLRALHLIKSSDI